MTAITDTRLAYLRVPLPFADMFSGRLATPSGRSGFCCDSTTAWSQAGGDVSLCALEDDHGRLVGWYRPTELTVAAHGPTLFDVAATQGGGGVTG